jgi:hypothetical protein
MGKYFYGSLNEDTVDKNHGKTLTVPKALFYRESVPLSIHGYMERMVIKEYPLWMCP